METMINLTDLLKHEILDLYSVEEQIIEAMPAMIEKAKNPELKRALREHLKITEEQKNRLDGVKKMFGEEDNEGEKKGFFSRLFGGSSGGEKCKGMEGIISEGEKMMSADVAEDALDAVIIACAQKIEHYEICGYGTARAYARELKLPEVERQLTMTLNEEYTADDMLTKLAVGKSNLEAERSTGMEESRGGNKNSKGSNSKSGSKGGSSKSSSKGATSKASSKGAASKSSLKGSGSRSSVSSKSANNSKGGSSKSSGSVKSGSSKAGTASKSGSTQKSSSKASSKGGNSKSGGSKGRSSRGR